MSKRRLEIIGVLSGLAILATIVIVRAMEAPVDQLGQAVASTLGSRPVDTDFIFETPWGLPRWVLIVDNAIGMALLAVVFLGGLPLAVIAVGLSFSKSHLAQPQMLASLARYCLVFQVSSLLLASAVTLLALILAGSEPFSEPWTWYHVATVPASIVALPIWRRNIQTTPLRVRIFNDRPA